MLLATHVAVQNDEPKSCRLCLRAQTARLQPRRLLRAAGAAGCKPMLDRGRRNLAEELPFDARTVSVSSLTVSQNPQPILRARFRIHDNFSRALATSSAPSFGSIRTAV